MLAKLAGREENALMKLLSEIARDHGMAEHAYIVGGAPRDFAMDAPIKDIDIVVEPHGGKNAETLAKALAKRVGAGSVAADQYGVVHVGPFPDDFIYDGVNLRGQKVEIVTSRKEKYEKGGSYKPSEVEPGTIMEDLLRRDFTFNLLVWRLLDVANGPDKAAILDLTGMGMKGLKEKIVTTPLDPAETFDDDPSRMLRAIRFAIKYGFKLDPKTRAAIKRMAPQIKRMPWEPIGDILMDKILPLPGAKKALTLMKGLGLLDPVLEMIPASFLRRQVQKKVKNVGLLLSLAGFSVPTGLDKLTAAQQRVLRRFEGKHSYEELESFYEKLMDPPVDIRKLMQKYELKQGPLVGEMISQARDFILDKPNAKPREIESYLDTLYGQKTASRIAQRFLEAAIFKGPPAMEQSIGDWMVSLYAGDTLARVAISLEVARKKQSGHKEHLDALEKMKSDLRRNIQALKIGEQLKLPINPIYISGRVAPFTLGVKRLADIQFGSHTGEAGYQMGQGKQRVTYKKYRRPMPLDEIVAEVEGALNHYIMRAKSNLEYIEEGRTDTEVDMVSVVDLELIRRECLKYTNKAKTYATKATKKFPLDIGGWQYIDWKEINAARKGLSDYIQAQIDEAEKHNLPNYDVKLPSGRQVSKEGAKNIQKEMLELTPATLKQWAKDNGWEHIVAVLDFKGHSQRGGQWNPYDKELQADVRNQDPRTVKEFRHGVSEIRRVVRHEVQHLGQNLLAEIKALPEEVAGLPSDELRNLKYKPSSRAVKHELRDIEFYTDLEDAIGEFRENLRNVSKKEWKDFFRYYTGQMDTLETIDFTNKFRIRVWRNKYFLTWKKEAPQKWKKAVGIMLDELRKKGIRL